MRPESCVAALVMMQTLSPVAFVWLMAPVPAPCVMPPFAAKFQPDAAVVPPFMPVVPVPQVAPVPEMRATLFAPAVTRLIEQIRTWRPLTPVMSAVVVAVETFTLTKESQTAAPTRKPPVAPEPRPPEYSARAGGAAPVAPLVSVRTFRFAAVAWVAMIVPVESEATETRTEPAAVPFPVAMAEPATWFKLTDWFAAKLESFEMVTRGMPAPPAPVPVTTALDPNC